MLGPTYHRPGGQTGPKQGQQGQTRWQLDAGEARDSGAARKHPQGTDKAVLGLVGELLQARI